MEMLSYDLSMQEATSSLKPTDIPLLVLLVILLVLLPNGAHEDLYEGSV